VIGVHFQKKNQVIGTYPLNALNVCVQVCDLVAAPARLASALDASCPNLRTLEILELPTAPDHKVVSHFQQLLALRRQEAGEVEKVFVSYCDE
jgi:hypothetical protein